MITKLAEQTFKDLGFTDSQRAAYKASLVDGGQDPALRNAKLKALAVHGLGGAAVGGIVGHALFRRPGLGAWVGGMASGPMAMDQVTSEYLAKRGIHPHSSKFKASLGYRSVTPEARAKYLQND